MSETASSPARKRSAWPWLIVVLVVATGVRLISLRHEAVWYDEVMILKDFDSPNVVRYVQDALPRTPVPPGFMITEYLWSRVVGTDVTLLRLWPLMCGIAGLGVLFVLTRRLLGAPTALITVAWVSFLYWHIHYSQEIRYYPLAQLLCLLSMWSFVEMCGAQRARWLLPHFLFNAAMVWTHPISVFLCAAQFAFLLLFRRNHPRIIAVWVGLHLALGATLYAFMASLDQEAAFAQAAWISKPTLWGNPPSVRNLFSMFSGVITLAPTNATGQKLIGLEPYTAAGLIFLHGVAGVLGVWAVLRRPKEPEAEDSKSPLAPKEIAALLLLWLILPPTLVFMVSHVWKSMFIVRYVLFASIPLYILLAYFLAARSRIVLAAAFALLLAHDALFYLPGPTRLPFDRVAARIEGVSTQPPIIYMDDMLGMPPIEFYWKGAKPEFRPSTKVDELYEGKIPAGDLWLVFTAEKRFEKSQKALKEAGLKVEGEEFRASKRLWTVHILGRAKAK